MEKDKDIESLFRQYYRPLCMFATHLLQDSRLVEDVVMDSYLKLWDKMKGDEIANPKSYLYATVRHSCFDQNWQEGSASPMREAIGEMVEEKADLEERSMIEARLWTAIDSLPSRCRTVFLMSKQDGMTYQEIAEELHLSVKTVEAQVCKAYRRLREAGRSIYHFFLSFL